MEGISIVFISLVQFILFALYIKRFRGSLGHIHKTFPPSSPVSIPKKPTANLLTGYSLLFILPYQGDYLARLL
jgi:hypothetical protein